MTTEEIKKWVNTHLHQHWTFDIDQSFREIREQNREIIAIGDAYTVEYYEEERRRTFLYT